MPAHDGHGSYWVIRTNIHESNWIKIIKLLNARQSILLPMLSRAKFNILFFSRAFLRMETKVAKNWFSNYQPIPKISHTSTKHWLFPQLCRRRFFRAAPLAKAKGAAGVAEYAQIKIRQVPWKNNMINKSDIVRIE